jgi:hypothetical protein
MHPQAHPQMTAAAQQHFAMQNSLMQQQRREGMKGNCLLRLMQFSEQLSSYEPVGRIATLELTTALVEMER